MVYSVNGTFLMKMNPSVKLLCLLAIFGLVVFIHNPNVLLFMLASFLVMTVFFSGHPKRYVSLYIASFLFLFVSASTTMIFFGQGQTTWFQWGLVHITEESFYTGIHLGLRATLFATLGLLFLLTTKPVHLFYSLMQQLHMPPTYAYAFLAAVRMLPMMVEDYQTLRYAYRIRGKGRKQKGSRLYRAFSFYVIPLLTQAIRRAQRLAIAMEAKQFQEHGQNRTYFYTMRCRRLDGQIVFVLVGLIVITYSLGQWFPVFPTSDIRLS
ncbi:energy-coupling factor transporter transmembrane component T [Shouchella sp. 1P09AA]|uniref:energy-coupling factor transporter transmembrane component T family protein n=1 Tax=unclassified Shouchella TaxID=2893065 RepID=UPI00399F6738